MVLSEFVLTRCKGKRLLDLVYFAEVDVTTETGKLWWKKTQCDRRNIARKEFGFWYFVDNGQMCHDGQVEALERSYFARKALDMLLKCEV